MTNIQSVGIRFNNQPPIVTENVIKDAKKVNFKAGNNEYKYTVPPMLDQQAQLEKMMLEQKKAERKQKLKNNLLTGLTIASSLVILAYFGQELRAKHLAQKGQKATRAALNEGEDIAERTVEQMLKDCKDPKIKRAIAEEYNKGFTASKKKITALDTLAGLKSDNPVETDIDYLRKILNEEVIGMDEAKEQIIKHFELRNHCIREGIPLDTPLVLALDGPPGTAKTTLANAVAKACKMPHKEISMAGMTGKAPIKGSESVYSGATWGEFADAQIEHKTKSIVYTLDEIEKTGISEHNGKAEDALLSVMDDRHFIADDFLGVDIDLKDSIIITTSNDYEKLSEAMKSRLSKKVNIKEYTPEIKEKIARFKANKFLKKYKVDEKIKISDEAYKALVDRHKDHKGGREISNEIRDLIESVIIKKEVRSATKDAPFIVTPKIVDDCLISLAA